MEVYCSFRSPKEACSAIGHVTDVKVGKLVRRPWKHYEPETSTWWLVPSRDWPVFQYGKYYFDRIRDDETKILCGLYVEKGLDPTVRDAYRSAKWAHSIMGPDWTWYRWLRDLESHRISDVVKSVARSSSLPVEFRIDGSHVSGPELDRSEPRQEYPVDLYHLRWRPDATEFEFVGAKRDADVLNELGGVKTFEELYRVLESFNNDPWLWIDVFIALQFPFRKGGDTVNESEQYWDAEKIWEKFLRHFLPWVSPA